MDNVLPEIRLDNIKSNQASKPISYIPRVGNKIEMYVGEPLDFSIKINKFRHKYPGILGNWRTTLESLELYYEIVYDIRNSLLLLEKEANTKEYNLIHNNPIII